MYDLENFSQLSSACRQDGAELVAYLATASHRDAAMISPYQARARLPGRPARPPHRDTPSGTHL